MRFNAAKRKRPPVKRDGISLKRWQAMLAPEQDQHRAIILRAYNELTMSMQAINAGYGYPMHIIREVCGPHKAANKERAKGYYNATMGQIGAEVEA